MKWITYSYDIEFRTIALIRFQKNDSILSEELNVNKETYNRNGFNVNEYKNH